MKKGCYIEPSPISSDHEFVLVACGVEEVKKSDEWPTVNTLTSDQS